ncbi:hypothetical protein A4X03_0g3400, partial [Tilletia caries]
MHVVHQLLFEGAQHASNKIEALLHAVYLWPEKRINAMRLGELSANEQVKTAFNERQRILDDVSTARVAYLRLYDRLSSLCNVTDTWARREKAITNELEDNRDAIASILAEADKHFGFGVTKRQEKLLKLVSFKLTENQQDQNHVERWFNLSTGDLDVVKDGNIPEAIEFSEWLAARITQLDDLVSALKRSDEALSLRIAASVALNAVEQDATIEYKKMGWSMFHSMDDLEKSMTNCDVEISTEDVMRHILELIDRTAKLFSSNKVVQEVRANIWDMTLVNYGEDIAKAMETSKKLFSLESFPPKGNNLAFSTHVLPWNGAPRELKQFAFPFEPPAKDALVLTFFKKIDNEDCSEDVSIASDYASDNHVLVKTNGETHIMSFDVSVLGISANDERFQAGTCCVLASGWCKEWCKDFGIVWTNSVKIDFPRPFHSTPKVRLFISALSAKREGHHDFNTNSWVESVTTQGFTLSALFLGVHTENHTLTISWIAHDPNEPTVRSGEIRHYGMEWVANKSGTVSFNKPFATGAPSILVAGIAGMHCNFPEKNLRFEIQESNIRPEGSLITPDRRTHVMTRTGSRGDGLGTFDAIYLVGVFV